MRRRALAVGLAGLLALGGAGVWAISQNLGTAPPAKETPTVEVPENARQVTALAIADLALRVGISEAEIRLVTLEAVDWPDTSLGCPQPGMAYAQVITPGYRIFLRAGGQTYEYHSSYTHVVYC